MSQLVLSGVYKSITVQTLTRATHRCPNTNTSTTLAVSKTRSHHQVKTIDICSVGVLRVTTALYQAKLLLEGSKMAVISSQGGSLAWRSVQCPEGGDYGHHMSKAAANMAGVLAANELKSKGIAVARD